MPNSFISSGFNLSFITSFYLPHPCEVLYDCYMNMKEISEYLTLKQVSELLKVHENTLRNWDREGRLKAIRIGGRNIRRWKKEDVMKFLEESSK